jgi:hypothetical protein
MQFPRKCKPWAAVGETGSRWDMKHVRLNPMRKREGLAADETQYPYESELVATDGKILTVIPVLGEANGEEPADSEGYVTADALKRARKLNGSKYANPVLMCNGGLKTCDGTESVRPPDSAFPNWMSVVPKEEKRKATIELDVARLYQICEAMGTTKVQLCFDPMRSAEIAWRLGATYQAAEAHMPIYVKPAPGTDEGHGFGVLMPLTGGH